MLDYLLKIIDIFVLFVNRSTQWSNSFAIEIRRVFLFRSSEKGFLSLLDVVISIMEVVELETGASTGGRFKLCEKLELQEFQEKFVFKTLDSPSQGFSIDRHDGNIEPLDGKDFYFLRIWLLI